MAPGWSHFGSTFFQCPSSMALRVPLRVQAAYLPQAYKLCSVRAIVSQTYGFSIKKLPLSEIIKATMGVRYFVTDPPWWP